MLTRESIVIKYKTVQYSCRCCGQELKDQKVSLGEFEIEKDSAAGWTDWDVYRDYPEDLEGAVNDFVYEYIRFHSLSSVDKIIIDDSELDRVMEFIVSALLTTVQGEMTKE